MPSPTTATAPLAQITLLLSHAGVGHRPPQAGRGFFIGGRSENRNAVVFSITHFNVYTLQRLSTGCNLMLYLEPNVPQSRDPF
jgi:hypothetical protein